MTPGARLAAAIAILEEWEAGAPLGQAFARWARGARYAGSKDRRAVRDHVFDVLRLRGTCAALGGGTGARALVLGLLRAGGIDPDTMFTGEGHAPPPPSDAERAAGGPPEPLADIPAWLRPPLAEALGPDLPAVADALGARAPLYLRVNAARATRAVAIARLRDDGIEAVPEPACETALRVTGGAAGVDRSAAFAEGLVEPQDLSVQIACASVDWGGRILDHCAGGGGKALAIAAATGAPVEVHDAHPARMADLPARALRAGADLRPVARPGPGYDIVLTDVPCSGSGTWRRDPEAKWRLTPARLGELQEIQAGILDAAAGLVVPGGRLVYMTCSFLRAENEDQVSAFAARHPGWRCVVERRLGPPAASDGFFVAELRAAWP